MYYWSLFAMSIILFVQLHSTRRYAETLTET